MQFDENLGLVEQRHPHIGKSLRLLWGFPEASRYIDKLLDDSRGGDRRGFSPEVLMALLSIKEKHQQPGKEDSGFSPWGQGREFFR